MEERKELARQIIATSNTLTVQAAEALRCEIASICNGSEMPVGNPVMTNSQSGKEPEARVTHHARALFAGRGRLGPNGCRPM